MPRSKPLPPQRRIKLGPLDVQLHHPLYGPVAAPATVYEHPDYGGSAFKQAPGTRGGFSTYFEVAVTALDFADAFLGGRKRSENTFDLSGEFWTGIREVYGEGRYSFSVDAERVRLAAVHITETPFAHVMSETPSWDAYLGKHFGEDFAAAVSQLRTMDDGHTIRRPLQTTGSLITAIWLRVHPLVRRQRIGTRLLHHVFWRLTRTDQDLLVDAVSPTPDPNQKRYRRPTIPELQALVQFAQAAGLHRLDDADIRPDNPIFVYRQVGLFDRPQPRG